MKSLDSELRDLEQQRRALAAQLNNLLDELEERPTSRRGSSWNPIDLLESAVDKLVLALERAVEKTVALVLDRVGSRRRG